VIEVVVALAATYVLLLVALLLSRPSGPVLRESLRLLPDLLRLVGRLARDRTIPRRTRALLWVLVAYLALPVDLVPDVVPVLGYADDLLAVRLVLRRVVRVSDTGTLERNWPGTEDGMRALRRLLGVRDD
jgi:uncharacterized membrane protein YkvA (DUF1232 family)